jgi:hypothetical protein
LRLPKVPRVDFARYGDSQKRRNGDAHRGKSYPIAERREGRVGRGWHDIVEDKRLPNKYLNKIIYIYRKQNKFMDSI